MTAKRPILLLSYGGFVTRNILLGGFSERVLAERPLVASVIDPQEQLLIERFAGRPVRLIHHETAPGRHKSTFEKAVDLGTYLYYFETGLGDAKGRRFTQKLIDGGHSFWGDRAISGLQASGRALKKLGLLKRLEALYLNGIASWPTTRNWVARLRELDPALVVSTMLTLAPKLHPSVDLAPVLAAHELGIPCGTLVQSWDNLLTKPSILPPFLDRYWTWSPWMSRQIHALHDDIAPDTVRVVGAPVFDFHRRPEMIEPRARVARALGLDERRPWMVFGTGTAKSLPFEHLVVRDLCLRLAERRPDVQMLVRLHPKDQGERWPEVQAELERCSAVIRKTAPEKPMDLGGLAPPETYFAEQLSSLHHAAVVINCSSTLTVDAALLDRPVVCIAYDLARNGDGFDRALAFSRAAHFQPLAETGGVRVVHCAGQALDAVQAYLEDPALDRLERRALGARVTDLEGNAGVRLAEEALNCLSSL
jgi:hypothetical protein